MKIKISAKYRAMVPPLEEKEKEALKEDIKKNGLHYPGIVNRDGVLLDGHHRYYACEELGLKFPCTTKYFKDETSEKLFIIDVNLKRRHLTLWQRISLLDAKAVILSEEAEKRKRKGKAADPNDLGSLVIQGRVAEQIAKDAGVGRGTVIMYNKIKKKASKKQINDLNKDSAKIKKIYNEIQYEEKKQEQVKIMKEHAQQLDEKSLKDLEKRFKLLPGDATKICKTLPAESVDLIFTDPVYLETHLYLYDELGKIASHLLKPGGSLVMYAAHIHLNKIFKFMDQYKDLQYYWIVCNKQEKTTQTHGRKVRIHWKPLLWYVKGKIDDRVRLLDDLIESKMPDKSTHVWAQSPVEAEYMIQKLTFLEDETVLDCYMGDGTTGTACVRQRRQFIGIEIDEEKFENASLRIKQSLLEFVKTRNAR